MAALLNVHCITHQMLISTPLQGLLPLNGLTYGLLTMAKANWTIYGNQRHWPGTKLATGTVDDTVWEWVKKIASHFSDSFR